jgi:tRNA threonylcarbamoyladenosine biosynthesis protein TsaE
MSAPSGSGFDVVAEAAFPDGGTLRIVQVPQARAAALLESLSGTRPCGISAAAAASSETALGLVAEVGGAPIAAVLSMLDGAAARLAGLAVHPGQRGRGVAAALVQTTTDLLAARGVRTLQLDPTDAPGWAPHWLHRHGFVPVPGATTWQLTVPILVEAPTAESMRELGRRLAALLTPGDVLIATGDLGAGKTTLTQGIGAGLAVSGPVISPTFVLSRVHPSTTDGPALVHVDAYRLGSFDELEDLDLEASLADSVTLIEWGGGIAEGLAENRLDIDIRRGLDPDDDTRLVFLAARGPRWADAPLQTLRHVEAPR